MANEQWRLQEKEGSKPPRRIKKGQVGVSAKGEEAAHGAPVEGTARGGPSEGGTVGAKTHSA